MSRPIRVLELRSVRGTGGGPEKTILRGAARTDRSRFAVTVCYIRDLRDRDFSMDRRAIELGVDYAEVTERHSLDPRIWPALQRLVRERQIDIVHSHEYKTNLLAWLLAKRQHIIPLSTVHGWFGRDTLRERLYYAVDKRLLARFPRVVAVSGPLRAELIRNGCKASRVTVIPNGIDHIAFARRPELREPMRKALGLEDGDIVVGAVGRLERQKRFDLLMASVARIRRTNPRVRLVIAGDGGLRDELARLRDKSGLGSSCVLLGHRSDVPELHHAFDLFAQASDREGSPNVVLEAMALCTPVVATDAGGTSDLITHGVHGLIVPFNDVNAMTAALESAISDPAGTHERAAAARLRVEHEFTFERRMALLETIYEELMANRPGHPMMAYASQ